MAKPNRFFIPGRLYSVEMIEAIAMAVHLGIIKPMELKRYLDGDMGDAYNILCELIKANAPAYQAKRRAAP